MWPKNLIWFSLKREYHKSFPLEALERCMDDLPIRALTGTEKEKLGFTPLYGHAVYDTEEAWVVATCHSKRSIPGTVLKEHIDTKTRRLEQAEGRRLKKKERDIIKEEVLLDLLPRAFTTKSTARVFFFKQTGLVAVEATSHKSAENLIALCRKLLGSLPALPVVTDLPIETTLTRWVKENELPKGFSLKHKMTLTSLLEQTAKTVFNNEELQSESALHHLENRAVTALELDWSDRIAFTLDSHLVFKSLKFSDELIAQNNDIEGGESLDRAAADMELMTSEMVALFAQTITALGGLPEEDQ